jgi:lipooligosaccharide transport system permease protein
VVTTGALRIVEREARVFRRLWRGSVFSTFLSPVLFLAAIGLGLGGLVDENQRSVDGLSYLHFVAPGLLVAGAMQSAAADSLWPVMAGTKWLRTFHGMVATPIGPADVFTGFVLWSAIRTTASASAFLLVAAVLGGVPSPWGILAVPAAVLCATAFCAPLAAYSATRDSDVSFPLVMRLGVMPLFLFSGTFFPVDQLPGWARPLAALSPLWHGVELSRAATTGTADGLAVAAHVVVLLGVIAAGGWVGARTWRHRLAA